MVNVTGLAVEPSPSNDSMSVASSSTLSRKHTLSPEERARIKAQMKTLSPEERAEFKEKMKTLNKIRYKTQYASETANRVANQMEQKLEAERAYNQHLQEELAQLRQQKDALDRGEEVPFVDSTAEGTSNQTIEEEEEEVEPHVLTAEEQRIIHAEMEQVKREVEEKKRQHEEQVARDMNELKEFAREYFASRPGGLSFR